MKGFAGLFWFLVPNVLCLVIFIPFAKQIRREMPFGITLSGYMAEKYQSVGVKRVYLFQLIGLSVLSRSSVLGCYCYFGGDRIFLLTIFGNQGVNYDRCYTDYFHVGCLRCLCFQWYPADRRRFPAPGIGWI